MEIIASSVQKVGDFFLHAGYASAQGFDVIATFPKAFVIVCFVGLLCLLNLLFDKPRTRAVLDLTLVAFLIYWLLGCGPPP